MKTGILIATIYILTWRLLPDGSVLVLDENELKNALDSGI